MFSIQSEFQLFCREEWAAISVSRSTKLAKTNPNGPAGVIAAERGPTRYRLNTNELQTFLIFISKKSGKAGVFFLPLHNYALLYVVGLYNISIKQTEVCSCNMKNVKKEEGSSKRYSIFCLYVVK
ncbi:hypothetical protein AMECASPLE_007050 [Ameca splendens]|uniref:Uncharacterized protein n=1 Tax=Ameca splendens TaxID=208324 RepID=A0ABV0ZYG6_9TELE